MLLRGEDILQHLLPYCLKDGPGYIAERDNAVAKAFTHVLEGVEFAAGVLRGVQKV